MVNAESGDVQHLASQNEQQYAFNNNTSFSQENYDQEWFGVDPEYWEIGIILVIFSFKNVFCCKQSESWINF